MTNTTKRIKTVGDAMAKATIAVAKSDPALAAELEKMAIELVAKIRRGEV